MCCHVVRRRIRTFLCPAWCSTRQTDPQAARTTRLPFQPRKVGHEYRCKSGGYSGHVDGSASCCMMRSLEECCINLWHYAVFYSGGHQCGGICKLSDIHTLLLFVRTIPVASRMLATCPLQVTLYSCLQFPRALANVSDYKVLLFGR